MFQKKDQVRNAYTLTGSFARKGYDWWWHSFTGINEKTGEEKSFFVEYYMCNPSNGRRYPILGDAKEGKKPSYIMVKAGCWGENHCQLHRFFGWKETKVRKIAPFEIRVEDCYASEHRLSGSIVLSQEQVEKHPEWMCDSGRMEWDLHVNKQIPFHVGYGAGWLLRKLKAFEMYWHAEGMKSQYAGTVVFNGETYKVIPEKSFGYADKNWGSNFTSPWLWLSSNCIYSKLSGRRLTNSVFDIGGGRPKVFGFPLEKRLLGAFLYEGKEYEFNFSKFWTMTGTKFHCHESDEEIVWHVRMENITSVLDVKVRCQKKDMLLINYQSPDGKKRHNRLWNGGNGKGNILLFRKVAGGLELIDDMYVTHVGCEYGEYDE